MSGEAYRQSGWPAATRGSPSSAQPWKLPAPTTFRSNFEPQLSSTFSTSSPSFNPPLIHTPPLARTHDQYAQISISVPHPVPSSGIPLSPRAQLPIPLGQGLEGYYPTDRVDKPPIARQIKRKRSAGDDMSRLNYVCIFVVLSISVVFVLSTKLTLRANPVLAGTKGHSRQCYDLHFPGCPIFSRTTSSPGADASNQYGMGHASFGRTQRDRERLSHQLPHFPHFLCDFISLGFSHPGADHNYTFSARASASTRPTSHLLSRWNRPDHTIVTWKFSSL